MAKKSFSAYQVELSYLVRNNDGIDVQKYKWDFNAFSKILEYIYKKSAAERMKKNNGGWGLSLDDLIINTDCLVGRLKLVEYGFKSNLYHVGTHISRDNPRDLLEGEEKYIYFYTRSSDGLLLLQNDIKANRAKFDEYIDAKGKEEIQAHYFVSVNIANLLKREFFDEINELDKIKKIVLEVKSKGQTGENEVVQNLQGSADEIEATHVQLSYSAKRIKEGMSISKVVPFIKRYKGKQGISSIKVIGEQSGAEKNIYVNKYSEKYTDDFLTDDNNMLKKDDVYQKIQRIGNSRDQLGD